MRVCFLCLTLLVVLAGCNQQPQQPAPAPEPEGPEPIAVTRWSDRVVATSDNPRREDPLAILADLERGLAKLQRVEPDALATQASSYCVEPDRRAAIELAIAIAEPDDIVVLAGKGHEDYQIVGHERLPFDDRQEAKRALEHRRHA